ncbi:MAG: pseudaminic acid synthase [Sterolibacteriaceae bacterium MAG5]|nr:pseudaminic acid synthase [Candidatus Nitricoxidireducens bremensis]
MKIGNRDIGPGHPPLVIAEMSGNHNRSLERALAIVDAAARAGAHALKLQTYTADTITLDCQRSEFMISPQASNPWAGKSLHQLYQEAYTPWEWHEPIFARARQLGMEAFSTPFDETAVDFLESLDVPCYKVASFENNDIPLLRRVAATGKPLIISTGMATVAELDEMVSAVRGAGCREVVLLKCTSNYPAAPNNTNLRTIPHLRQLFSCEVGLSDHTMGVGAAIAAVALGATVIEKHFTLSRADGGVDASFSMEPDEMTSLVVESERAWQAMGEIKYGPTEGERGSLVYRRSLYLVSDMKAGDLLSVDNVRSVRPGLGMSPKFLEQVLGMQIKKDAIRGMPLTWDLLKP